jgi:hypothetical protein
MRLLFLTMADNIAFAVECRILQQGIAQLLSKGSLFMRYWKTLLATSAAIAVASAPVAAQAATSKAKPVTETVKRANPAKKAESKLGGGSGLLIALAAAAAVIVGIVVLSDDNPSSP